MRYATISTVSNHAVNTTHQRTLQNMSWLQHQTTSDRNRANSSTKILYPRRPVTVSSNPPQITDLFPPMYVTSLEAVDSAFRDSISSTVIQHHGITTHGDDHALKLIENNGQLCSHRNLPGRRAKLPTALLQTVALQTAWNCTLCPSFVPSYSASRGPVASKH